MAAEVSQYSTTSPELPPTPPAAVYSHGIVRRQTPQILTPPDDLPTANEAAFHHNNAHHTMSNLRPPEAAAIVGEQTDRSWTPDRLCQGAGNVFDPTKLSPGPSNIYERRPLNEKNRNLSDTVHRRAVSDTHQNGSMGSLLPSGEPSARHASSSALQFGSQDENFEPLQYHHQVLEDTELQKRTSKLTIGTTGSDGSAHGEAYARRGRPTGDSARNSGVNMFASRPTSAYSDLRGRSPYGSPGPNLRAVSGHSRSPDTRLSFGELLNQPYPQPAPAGSEFLVDKGLAVQSMLGPEASRMSTLKSLEMYRANAKKSTSSALQYEFAVFMVSVAQQEGLEEQKDTKSESGHSDKAQHSIREDLLKEAKSLLTRLSDKSYPFAQYYLADGYSSGLWNKGREDWEHAFPLFLAAAKHGHAEAGYRTALCYEFGWGANMNAAKAVQFYQQSASKNHPGAMLRLGRACLTGEMSLSKRYREGVRWLTRAAEAADYQYNSAPYDLGCLYETGYGPDVFKDETYAAQLFTKAADLDHIEANFRMGQAYEYGQLQCPKDAALSVHYYTSAAQQGHAAAQMALSAWYLLGVPNFLEKDDAEAYEWARRAAESGLPKAQYAVGFYTEMGMGCRKDPLEANVWYVRAADQGEERAKHRIAAIRAAAMGADPLTAAASRIDNTHINGKDEKKKKFGIF